MFALVTHSKEADKEGGSILFVGPTTVKESYLFIQAESCSPRLLKPHKSRESEERLVEADLNEQGGRRRTFTTKLR